MTTFTGTYKSGIALVPAQNPATVAASGYVTNTNTTVHFGDAIYGSTAAVWNITNFGIVKSTGASSAGIDLRAGGVVTNAAAGALISGAVNGIFIKGNTGSVSNSGTIQGTGTTGAGVYLYAGGLVANSAGGLITGVVDGLAIGHGSGSVSNAGTIKGTGTNGGGVFLTAGGYINNAAGGSIIGVLNGVEISNTAGLLRNSGTILGTGTQGGGVFLTAGGTVVNYATGRLLATINGIAINNAGGTVINSGSIFQTGSINPGNGGVSLRGPGVVINNAGGLISSYIDGVIIGVTAGNAGALFNSGVIRGTAGGADGVRLNGGGYINNASGGSINGGLNGVEIDTAAGTVNNAGAIFGTSSTGILVYSGSGSVTNSSSGVITGSIAGVQIGSTAGGVSGTVTNSGTIAGISTVYATGVGDAVFISSGSGLVANNVGGRLTGINNGVEITASAGTVNNSGSISGTGSLGAGIFLRNGSGFVSNSSVGVVSGYYDGVRMGSVSATSAGTVVNSGQIVGTTTRYRQSIGDGIYIAAAGGAVTNNSGGQLVGVNNGVEINSVVAVARNSGTIAGSGSLGAGIFLRAAGGYVSNGSAGVIRGVLDGVLIGTAGAVAGLGTVVNYGVISGYGGSGFGVFLQTGAGFVSNRSGGAIVGVLDGVKITSSAGTVSNAGIINATATGGIGVYLKAGSVTNSGTIAGGTNGTGVYVRYGNVTNSGAGSIIAAGASGTAVSVANGTFFNSGLVQGRVSGIQFTATPGSAPSGRVNVSGSVVGATGITVLSGTASQTLTVAGNVTGTGGTAVSLTKAGSDRLILAPGAAFTGKVDGGSGKSVLEVSTSGGTAPAGLEGTAAATAYVNLGSVTNFSALQVDPGATTNTGGIVSFDTLVNQGQINLAAGDSLAVGTVAAAATGGTIDLKSGGIVHFTGAVAAGQTVLFRPPGGGLVLDHPEQFAGAMTEFAASDLIDLPLGKASFQQYAGGVLSLSYGGGTVMLHLATTVTTPQFLLTDDGHGGTDIAVSGTVCFCRGTRVLTAQGEVAVEDLAVGERVVTLSGALKSIRWIGMGRDLVTRANRLARPIIVQRGALSDGVPHRDLYLTHGHALYIDGLLIPVEHLVNHRTIRWDESARVVEYYHIELEDHDVLLAEGAPAESYYDAGNRAFFQNARPGSPAGQARRTFAPVLNRGKIVERIWARLFDRASGRIATETTDDPDLHLVVDGVRLDPAAVEDGVFAFALQAAPIETLLLRSRCGVPSLLGQSRRDHRPLGVTIRQIVLHHAGIATCFDYDQPQLREGGCYPPEDGFSWTDGEFALPARFFIGLRGPLALLVCTEPRTGTRYPLATTVAQAA